MAFNPALLTKLQPSTLFTQPSSIPSVQPSKAAVQFWTYQAGSDNKATVEASGYFNYFSDWTQTLQYNNGQYLQVGDLIYCVCSDGSVYLTVVTIGKTITTAVFGGGGGGSGGSSDYPALPLISTYWYFHGVRNAGAGSAAPTAVSTGTLYFYPFYNSISGTYTKISSFVDTGVAATNCNMGIYASNNANTQPTGSPLANSMSGNVSTATSATPATFTFGSPITLAANTLYWLAITYSGAPSMATQQAPNQGFFWGFSFGAPTLSATPAITLGWKQTFVYNATLPAVGALSAITSNDTTDNFSVIGLQAQ